MMKVVNCASVSTCEGVFAQLKELDILRMLGIPVSSIVDKAVLPRRYLELKFLVTHFMTYGDEDG